MSYDTLGFKHNTSGLKDEAQAIAQAAGALAIDFSQGKCATVTLSGNQTSYAFSGAVGGDFCAVVFVQDATGSRTITSAASTIKLASGLTLTTAASKRDLVVFYFDGLNYCEVSRLLNQ